MYRVVGEARKMAGGTGFCEAAVADYDANSVNWHQHGLWCQQLWCQKFVHY